MKLINTIMFYNGTITVNSVLVCNDLPEPIPNDVTTFNHHLYNSIITYTYELRLRQ